MALQCERGLQPPARAESKRKAGEASSEKKPSGEKPKATRFAVAALQLMLSRLLRFFLLPFSYCGLLQMLHCLLAARQEGRCPDTHCDSISLVNADHVLNVYSFYIRVI